MIASAAFADQPQRVSNTQKYKDAGLKPATGRAGSATVTARALLGKDHVASLDVTTGALDTAATAPGNIDKVQLKMFAGSEAYTKNYNGLKAGGSFALAIPGMSRHEKFQIQTNVSGIDPKRTGVVTVEETVKLRPDVAVTNLQAPAQVRENIPVNLSAVVSEMNGDVGARSNCILTVDGNIVDQSAGIWTDAAGTVSCVFTYAFSGIGTHAVVISANDVVPGDYDLANNGVSGNVEVVRPEQPFSGYSAHAEDLTSSRKYYYSSPWYHHEYTENGWRQSTNMYAWGGPLRAGNALIATVRETSNGTVIDDLTASMTNGWNSDSGDGYSAGCVSSWDAASYRWINACGDSWGDGPSAGGSSWIQTSRYAGDVTYHSSGWDRYYWYGYESGYYYTWNYSGHDVMGTRASFGSTVVTDLTLSDGNTTYSATATVELQPVDEQYVQPLNCYEGWGWYWYGYYGTVCQEDRYSVTGVRGWTSN